MSLESDTRPLSQLTDGDHVSPRIPAERIVRIVIWMVVFALLATFFWYFVGLVIYLFLGLMIAYLLRPLVDRIQRLGVGRVTAILTGFVVFIGGISALVTLLVPFAAKQVTMLTQQISRKSSVEVTEIVAGEANILGPLAEGDVILSVNNVAVHGVNRLRSILAGVAPDDIVALEVESSQGQRRSVLVVASAGSANSSTETADNSAQGQLVPTLGLRLRTVLFSDVMAFVEEQIGRIVPVEEGALEAAVSGAVRTIFLPERLSGFVGSLVSLVTNIFYAVIVIPFVAFFSLKDGKRIRQSLYRLVPNRYFEMTLTINEKIESNIGRYFRGLFVQCCAVAAVAWALLSIVGLNSALAVGVFTGIANSIPYIGPAMGFLAGTLMGVAQTGDFSLLPGVLVAMAATQLTDNILFQPMIFSRAARAHPLVILFVVLIGAKTGGIIGMLVAIPITTVAVVALRQLSWSRRNYHILRAAR